MQMFRRAPITAATGLIALAILTGHTGVAQSPSFSTIYSFKGGADGASPHAGVIHDKNGALYGTTYQGGTRGHGTVFRLGPGAAGSWTETVLHNFGGPDGALPGANLVFGSTGALYGTTLVGGNGINVGGGTVFELKPPSTAGGAWTEAVLYSLPGGCSGQRNPYGALFIGSGGALFDTAIFNECVPPGGIADGGTVFMLTPPAASGGTWTEHTLLNLDTSSVGIMPEAGVVSVGGSLYGTTYFSSILGGCGAIYELAPPATAGGPWTGTSIHNFAGGDGCNSVAALTVGQGGVLYGTTLYGGSGMPCNVPNNVGGCGTVFQLTPPAIPGGTWTETVIYSFTATNGDGAYPAASVVIGKNGVLYGTTQYGGSAITGSPCSYYGASGCGTVFQLTPPVTAGGSWTETVLHSLTGQSGEGSGPTAGLTQSSTGVLYGTTPSGGTAGKGTVFSVTP